MKTAAKSFVASILGWQVRRLCKKNNFKVIAVTGSIGKTSTKLAIAQVLSQNFKVQFQDGNYNDLVTVPLIFFGQAIPSLFNPLAWLAVFWKNQKQLGQPYPYQVVVLELGTDGPGQIQQFGRYLHTDIAVLTAITPEHMEYFADLSAVAKEELSINEYSDKVLVNNDLSPEKFTKTTQNKITYGVKKAANYQIANVRFNGEEASFDFLKDKIKLFSGGHERITEPQLYSVCAAAAIATELGMSPADIGMGINQIKAVNGRMNRLAGVNGSTIIDDTYNASPEAMRAALDTLYRLEAPQKIALLGNMNELGKYSEEEHRKIGEYCDPKKLSLVLTLGPDANKYLAQAAEGRGCKVVTFDNPYTAGEYLKKIVQKGTILLAKGSQNGVFAEETVRLLLADTKDQSKLVRQSPDWLTIKAKAFKQ